MQIQFVLGMTVLIMIMGFSLTAAIATMKHRNAFGYGLLGMLFPLPAILVALALPDRPRY